MSNYINGYSYPRIIIRAVSDGSVTETIDLDLTMSGGLVETFEEYYKSNELETGEIIDYDFKGSRINFQLDYSEYVRKSNMLKIEKIRQYAQEPESYSVWLTPRVDVQVRSYEVRPRFNYSIGVLTGGSNTQGNRLVSIEFVTKGLHYSLLQDPDNLSVFSIYKAKF